MAIIKQYHKDTDTTYVYESESYWDPELKQARSKRKCIGKINPETGEIVPTGRRGKRSGSTSAPAESAEYNKLLKSNDELKKMLLDLNTRISELEKELSEETRKSRILESKLSKIIEIAQ